MQVKFSAIEIKVQFTILLENFEEDFRLLMNDLTNLFAVHSSLKKNFRQYFQIISVQKKNRNESFPLTLQRSSTAADSSNGP